MPGQEIVVIGDEDAVFGLGLIGLKGQVVESIEQAREAIRKAMADPATGLILLSENWTEARTDTMDESGALIVEIPTQGPVKASIALETRVERALGVRLEH